MSAGEASGKLFEDFPVAPKRVSEATAVKGAARVLLPNRKQMEFRASDLDSVLPEGHRARLVWGYVERQDLSAIYEPIKAREGAVGRGAIAAAAPHPLTRRARPACQTAGRGRASEGRESPWARRGAPAGIGTYELGAFTETRHRHRAVPELRRRVEDHRRHRVARRDCENPLASRRVRRHAPRRGCPNSSTRPDPKAPQRFCDPSRRPRSVRGCATRQDGPGGWLTRAVNASDQNQGSECLQRAPLD